MPEAMMSIRQFMMNLHASANPRKMRAIMNIEPNTTATIPNKEKATIRLCVGATLVPPVMVNRPNKADRPKDVKKVIDCK